MLLTRALVVGISTFALVAVSACSIGEVRHLTEEDPVQTVSAVKTCDGAFTKPDVSTLVACGEGKGHCYPSTKTMLSQLPDCEKTGDACIPDKILEANGAPLKACTFFIGGKPGACLSTLVKDIDTHKDQLQQDVCDADERCTPCVSPLDGSNTHICEPAGVYDTECKGGTSAKLPVCCHGQGLCMTRDGVPEDSRDDMSRDICPSDLLCAPAAMVLGNPEHCNALGASGVCIDLCFAKMLGPAAPVIRAGCGPSAVCLPCVIGKSRGMPGCD